VPNDLLDAFVQKALERNPGDRYGSASEMLQEWWQVVAALDRDAPLFEGTDVVFEEDEPSNTLVDQSGPSGSGSGSTMPNLSTTLDETSVPTDGGSKVLREIVEREREIVRKQKDGTG